jgi:hypothetical protein
VISVILKSLGAFGTMKPWSVVLGVFGLLALSDADWVRITPEPKDIFLIERSSSNTNPPDFVSSGKRYRHAVD